MIINEQSPLRRLPSNISPKQRMFFDAIRYCVEMIDLSYQNLQKTLLKLTLYQNQKQDHLDYVSAIYYTWSIVDSIYRLQGLLLNCPGLKQKSPGLRVFFNNIKDAEPLRHFFQHINNNINALLEKNIPVWGNVKWLTVQDISSGRVFSCSIVAGTILEEMENYLINPAGKKILPPVDHITLTAGDYSICLSHVFRHIVTLTKQIEHKLKEQFMDLPQAGADLTFCLEFASSEDDEFQL